MPSVADSAQTGLIPLEQRTAIGMQYLLDSFRKTVSLYLDGLPVPGAFSVQYEEPPLTGTSPAESQALVESIPLCSPESSDLFLALSLRGTGEPKPTERIGNHLSPYVDTFTYRPNAAQAPSGFKRIRVPKQPITEDGFLPLALFLPKQFGSKLPDSFPCPGRCLLSSAGEEARGLSSEGTRGTLIPRKPSAVQNLPGTSASAPSSSNGQSPVVMEFPCLIEAYHPPSAMFTVQLLAPTIGPKTRYLSRASVLFDGENLDIHLKRVDAAKTERREYERQLRLDLFKQLIPVSAKDEAESMSDPVMRRVLFLATKGLRPQHRQWVADHVSLAREEHAVAQRKIRLEYFFTSSLVKLLLKPLSLPSVVIEPFSRQHRLSDGEVWGDSGQNTSSNDMEVSVAFPNDQLYLVESAGATEKKPPAKNGAAEGKRRKRIDAALGLLANSLQYQDPTAWCLMQMRDIWSKRFEKLLLIDMRPYEVKTMKLVPIADFLHELRATMDAAHNMLQLQYCTDLDTTISTTIGNRFSYSYLNAEDFFASRFGKFFRTVRTEMSRRLRSITLRCLEHYRHFFDLPDSEKVPFPQKEGGFEVEGYYPRGRSILELGLVLSSRTNRVVFEPGLPQIFKSLREVVNEIMECTGTVVSLENIMMGTLGLPQIHISVAATEEVASATKAVEGAWAFCEPTLVAVVDILNEFSGPANLIEDIVLNFDETLKSYLEGLLRKTQELEKCVPTVVYAGAVAVNCSQVKQQLRLQMEQLIQNTLKAVLGRIQSQTESCQAELNSILTRIQVRPTSAELMQDLISYTQKAREVIHRIQQKDLLEIFTFVDALESNLIPIPEELSEPLMALFQGPGQVAVALDESDAKLLEERDSMIQILSEERNFISQLISETADKLEDLFYIYEAHKADDAHDILHGLQRAFEKIDSLTETLHSREIIFGLPPHEFDRVPSLRNSFDVFEQFWSTFSAATHGIQVIVDQPISMIHAEKFVDDLEKWRRLLRASARSLRGFSELAALGKRTEVHIASYQSTAVVLDILKSPGIRAPHWRELSRRMGLSQGSELLPTDSNLTFQKLVTYDLIRYIDIVNEIVSTATDEFTVENKLEQMRADCRGVKLQFADVPSDDSMQFLRNTVELIASLDHFISDTQMLRASPHIGSHLQHALEWEGLLGRMQETLSLWTTVQDLWEQLHPIIAQTNKGGAITAHAPTVSTPFDDLRSEGGTSNSTTPATTPATGTRPQIKAPAVSKEKEKESSLMEEFREADRAFRMIVEEVDRHQQSLLSIMTLESLPKRLSLISDILLNVRKGVLSLMDAKREVFPRFYFLSNQDMLTCLSAANLNAINRLLPKMYFRLSLLVTNGHEVTYFCSSDGVRLKNEGTNFRLTNEPIESWMGKLDLAVKISLRNGLEACMKEHAKTPLRLWMFKWNPQFVDLTLRIRFSEELKEVIGLTGVRGLAAYSKKVTRVLQECFTISSGRKTLKRGDAQTLSDTITAVMHQKEVVDALNLENVSTLDELRSFPYFDTTLERGEVRVNLLGAVQSYGYEFLGQYSAPMFTRDRVTACRSLFLDVGCSGSTVVCGVETSGKAHIVRDIAFLLGRFVWFLPCLAKREIENLRDILRGCAAIGSWLCLTDIDEMTELQSFLLGSVAEELRKAVEGKANTLQIPHASGGYESVPLKTGFAVIGSTSARFDSLNVHLQRSFRPLHLHKPDFRELCKIFLCAAGFDQLPSHLHEDLSSIFNIGSVLLPSVCTASRLHQLIKMAYSTEVSKLQPEQALAESIAQVLDDDTLLRLRETLQSPLLEQAARYLQEAEKAALQSVNQDSKTESSLSITSFAETSGTAASISCFSHEIERDLEDRLPVDGSHLLIVGPSLSGRTSLIRRFIHDSKVIHVSPRSIAARDLFGTIENPGLLDFVAKESAASNERTVVAIDNLTSSDADLAWLMYRDPYRRMAGGSHSTAVGPNVVLAARAESLTSHSPRLLTMFRLLLTAEVRDWQRIVIRAMRFPNLFAFRDSLKVFSETVAPIVRFKFDLTPSELSIKFAAMTSMLDRVVTAVLKGVISAASPDAVALPSSKTSGTGSVPHSALDQPISAEGSIVSIPGLHAKPVAPLPPQSPNASPTALSPTPGSRNSSRVKKTTGLVETDRNTLLFLHCCVYATIWTFGGTMPLDSPVLLQFVHEIHEALLQNFSVPSDQILIPSDPFQHTPTASGWKRVLAEPLAGNMWPQTVKDCATAIRTLSGFGISILLQSRPFCGASTFLNSLSHDTPQFSTHFVALSEFSGVRLLEGDVTRKLTRRRAGQYGPVIGRRLLLCVDDLHLVAKANGAFQRESGSVCDLLKFMARYQRWSSPTLGVVGVADTTATCTVGPTFQYTGDWRDFLLLRFPLDAPPHWAFELVHKPGLLIDRNLVKDATEFIRRVQQGLMEKAISPIIPARTSQLLKHAVLAVQAVLTCSNANLIPSLVVAEVTRIYSSAVDFNFRAKAQRWIEKQGMECLRLQSLETGFGDLRDFLVVVNGNVTERMPPEEARRWVESLMEDYNNDPPPDYISIKPSDLYVSSPLSSNNTSVIGVDALLSAGSSAHLQSAFIVRSQGSTVGELFGARKEKHKVVATQLRPTAWFRRTALDLMSQFQVPGQHVAVITPTTFGIKRVIAFALWAERYQIVSRDANVKRDMPKWRSELRTIVRGVSKESGDRVGLILQGALLKDPDVSCVLDALMRIGNSPGLFLDEEYTALLDSCRGVVSAPSAVSSSDAGSPNNDGGDRDFVNPQAALIHRLTQRLKIVGCFSSLDEFDEAAAASPLVGAMIPICIHPPTEDDALRELAASYLNPVVKNEALKDSLCDAAVLLFEGIKNTFQENILQHQFATFVALIADLYRKKVPKLQEVLEQNSTLNATVAELQVERDRQMAHRAKVSPEIERLATEITEDELQLNQLVAQEDETRARLNECEAKTVQSVSIIESKKHAVSQLRESAKGLVEESRTELKEMDPKQLTNLRMTSSPPQKIKYLAECICLLFGVKPDKNVVKTGGATLAEAYWQLCRRLMEDPDFISSCLHYGIDALTFPTEEKLRPYVESFSTTRFSTVSPFAQAMATWICALHQWILQEKSAAAMDEEIRVGREAMMEMLETLEKHRDTLQKQVSRVNQLREHLTAQRRKRQELLDELSSCEKRYTNTNTVVTLINKLAAQWHDDYQNVRLTFRNIAGDIFVAACDVTFQFSLDQAESRAIDSIIKDTLEELEIPHSPTVDVAALLAQDTKLLVHQIHGVNLPPRPKAALAAVAHRVLPRWPLFITESVLFLECLEQQLNAIVPKLYVSSVGEEGFFETLLTALKTGSGLLLKDFDGVLPSYWSSLVSLCSLLSELAPSETGVFISLDGRNLFVKRTFYLALVAGLSHKPHSTVGKEKFIEIRLDDQELVYENFYHVLLNTKTMGTAMTSEFHNEMRILQRFEEDFFRSNSAAGNLVITHREALIASDELIHELTTEINCVYEASIAMRDAIKKAGNTDLNRRTKWRNVVNIIHATYRQLNYVCTLAGVGIPLKIIVDLVFKSSSLNRWANSVVGGQRLSAMDEADLQRWVALSFVQNVLEIFGPGVSHAHQLVLSALIAVATQHMFSDDPVKLLDGMIHPAPHKYSEAAVETFEEFVRLHLAGRSGRTKLHHLAKSTDDSIRHFFEMISREHAHLATPKDSSSEGIAEQLAAHPTTSHRFQLHRPEQLPIGFAAQSPLVRALYYWLCDSPSTGAALQELTIECGKYVLPRRHKDGLPIEQFSDLHLDIRTPIQYAESTQQPIVVGARTTVQALKFVVNQALALDKVFSLVSPQGLISSGSELRELVRQYRNTFLRQVESTTVEFARQSIWLTIFCHVSEVVVVQLALQDFNPKRSTQVWIIPMDQQALEQLTRTYLAVVLPSTGPTEILQSVVNRPGTLLSAKSWKAVTAPLIKRFYNATVLAYTSFALRANLTPESLYRTSAIEIDDIDLETALTLLMLHVRDPEEVVLKCFRRKCLALWSARCRTWSDAELIRTLLPTFIHSDLYQRSSYAIAGIPCSVDPAELLDKVMEVGESFWSVLCDRSIALHRSSGPELAVRQVLQIKWGTPREVRERALPPVVKRTGVQQPRAVTPTAPHVGYDSSKKHAPSVLLHSIHFPASTRALQTSGKHLVISSAIDLEVWLSSKRYELLSAFGETVDISFFAVLLFEDDLLLPDDAVLSHAVLSRQDLWAQGESSELSLAPSLDYSTTSLSPLDVPYRVVLRPIHHRHVDSSFRYLLHTERDSTSIPTTITTGVQEWYVHQYNVGALFLDVYIAPNEATSVLLEKLVLATEASVANIVKSKVVSEIGQLRFMMIRSRKPIAPVPPSVPAPSSAKLQSTTSVLGRRLSNPSSATESPNGTGATSSDSSRRMSFPSFDPTTPTTPIQPSKPPLPPAGVVLANAAAAPPAPAAAPALDIRFKLLDAGVALSLIVSATVGHGSTSV